MTILILTPIKIEYTQVRNQLVQSSLKRLVRSGVTYEKGQFLGRNHDFTVYIKQTGSKNINIALATQSALQDIQPTIVILTGIAGGVKDVNIGDVLVANKLYGYESGKETDKGFVSRPEAIYCSPDLYSLSESITRNNNWKRRSNFAQTSTVFYGPIAAGDKVVSSKKSIVYQRLKTHFNDTLGIEMEAIGFGKAMLWHPLIKFINIRGISDLLDDKSDTDQQGCQQIAIENAVAFVFELLHTLDYSKLNIPNEMMELKPFTKKLMDVALPVLNQPDLNDKTANPYLSVLVAKLKASLPIAFKELATNVQDVDNQADFRSELRRLLQQNENLTKELAALMEKSELAQPNTSGNTASGDITMSDNTINAEEVHVGHKNKIGMQVNNFGKVGKQVNVERNEGDIIL